MTEEKIPLSQLRRGTTELCVLALLQDRQRYALELAEELSSARDVVTGHNTVYPVVKRLLRQGLLTSTWQPFQTGPRRRYYQLTELGRHFRLTELRAEWSHFRDAVDEILDD